MLSREPMVFEASRLKAAFAAVSFGAVSVLMISVQLAGDSSEQSVIRMMLGWAFVAMFSWLALASVARLAFTPRVVVDHHGIRLEGGLRPATLAWAEVSRIDVIEVRGMAWLLISGREPHRGISLEGWRLSAQEMKSRIISFRQGLEHDPSPGDIASFVPEEESDERNRLRRQGMIVVVIGAGMAFLSMSDARMAVMQHFTSGADIRWSLSPTYGELALAVTALLTVVAGLVRWLCPVGKRANPPLLSTKTELTVLGLCALPLSAAAWMLFNWIAHPV